MNVDIIILFANAFVSMAIASALVLRILKREYSDVLARLLAGTDEAKGDEATPSHPQNDTGRDA